MRIVVNKQWRVYLDFGRAGSLSLQLYRTYHRLLHMRVAVDSHALPIYKKNRIASLLCIFETTIILHNKIINEMMDGQQKICDHLNMIKLKDKWSVV